jgi:hypothetical protein
MSNFGTTPGAVLVPGMNSWVVGGTVTVQGTVSNLNQAIGSIANTASGVAFNYGFNGTGANTWTPLLTNGSGILLVAGQGLTDGSASAGQQWSKIGANVVSGTTGYTVNNSYPLTMNAAGWLNVVANGTTSVSQSGAPWTVAGTVSVASFPANQLISGTVGVTQATTPWTVTGTITQGGAPWSVTGTLSTAVLNFTPVTTAVPAASFDYGYNGSASTWSAQYLDPCQSAVLSFADFASTTSGSVIVTGVANKKTYICGMVSVVSVATSYSLIEGTGSACATGTLAAVMLNTGTVASNGAALAANGGYTFGNMQAHIAQSQNNGQNICIIFTGGAQVNTHMGYVQL